VKNVNQIVLPQNIVGRGSCTLSSKDSKLKKPSVAIMLPTYCEAGNIESLIRKIKSLKPDSLIVVIDDSSHDGTASIAEKLQKEFNNILVFTRPAKLGLGTAITDGFKLILSLENPPDYIISKFYRIYNGRNENTRLHKWFPMLLEELCRKRNWTSPQPNI